MSERPLKAAARRLLQPQFDAVEALGAAGATVDSARAAELAATTRVAEAVDAYAGAYQDARAAGWSAEALAELSLPPNYGAEGTSRRRTGGPRRRGSAASAGAGAAAPPNRDAGGPLDAATGEPAGQMPDAASTNTAQSPLTSDATAQAHPPQLL